MISNVHYYLKDKPFLLYFEDKYRHDLNLGTKYGIMIFDVDKLEIKC